ncbi:hypothetical protein [Sphingomonas sp.]|uniref:hypothetical protein n=1 Tax=Sphingomonas sp. TaxID=28214 RepID=UPI002DD6A767|nr:hypothetical protein [Sphingomonas sp.]
MGGDDECEFTGPLVVLRAEGDAILVLIEPPLPDGDHRRAFAAKETAWQYAQSLWTSARTGVRDETIGNFGHVGPRSATRER